jgi:hypothetical protein
MPDYVWQHDLKGEADRLRLMSDLLDPSSRFHLLQTGVKTGWRCLEVGAGNPSYWTISVAFTATVARFPTRE